MNSLITGLRNIRGLITGLLGDQTSLQISYGTSEGWKNVDLYLGNESWGALSDIYIGTSSGWVLLAGNLNIDYYVLPNYIVKDYIEDK